MFILDNILFAVKQILESLSIKNELMNEPNYLILFTRLDLLL
jgi:hypothetical protein